MSIKYKKVEITKPDDGSLKSCGSQQAIEEKLKTFQINNVFNTVYS